MCIKKLSQACEAGEKIVAEEHRRYALILSNLRNVFDRERIKNTNHLMERDETSLVPLPTLSGRSVAEVDANAITITAVGQL
jgi:hypothetical protein